MARGEASPETRQQLSSSPHFKHGADIFFIFFFIVIMVFKTEFVPSLRVPLSCAARARPRSRSAPRIPCSAMGAIAVQPVASDEDLQNFRSMTVQYLEWLGEDLSFQDVQAELAALPGSYRAEAGGCMLLAFERHEDGAAAPVRCIGAVALRALAGAHAGGGGGEVAGVPVAAACEMKRLFVLPERQGLGAGAALVQALLKSAQGLGYRAVVLDTLGRLAGANRLYKAQGFQACPPYNDCPLPGVLYFVKHLDA